MNPEWGLSLRQINELCDEMEAELEQLEKERESKPAAPGAETEGGRDNAP